MFEERLEREMSVEMLERDFPPPFLRVAASRAFLMLSDHSAWVVLYDLWKL